MKRYGLRLGILTAAVLASSAPVLAHEDCADDKGKSAMAERDAGISPQAQRGSNVAINCFNTNRG
jgi:hypothetical protein